MCSSQKQDASSRRTVGLVTVFINVRCFGKSYPYILCFVKAECPFLCVMSNYCSVFKNIIITRTDFKWYFSVLLTQYTFQIFPIETDFLSDFERRTID